MTKSSRNIGINLFTFPRSQ